MPQNPFAFDDGAFISSLLCSTSSSQLLRAHHDKLAAAEKMSNPESPNSGVLRFEPFVTQSSANTRARAIVSIAAHCCIADVEILRIQLILPDFPDSADVLLACNELLNHDVTRVCENFLFRAKKLKFLELDFNCPSENDGNQPVSRFWAPTSMASLRRMHRLFAGIMSVSSASHFRLHGEVGATSS